MAARGLITQFEVDPDRLAVIAKCTDHYDVGDGDAAEWPNNILSRRLVVYGSGRIARAGQEVAHAVDPGELALCGRLSSEIASLMAGTEVGMGTAASDEFHGFFMAGNAGEAVPGAISEAVIWERFNGTIFPQATITVEPLAEQGVWWSEVEYDGQDSGDSYFVPWRRMIDWFKGRDEFVDTAFVRVGNDSDTMWVVWDPEWPEGTENPGCVFPRLALGLTRGGSLVGLFGVCVKA